MGRRGQNKAYMLLQSLQFAKDIIRIMAEFNRRILFVIGDQGFRAVEIFLFSCSEMNTSY